VCEIRSSALHTVFALNDGKTIDLVERSPLRVLQVAEMMFLNLTREKMPFGDSLSPTASIRGCVLLEFSNVRFRVGGMYSAARSLPRVVEMSKRVHLS
jgi:hypothetical protein